MRIALFIIFLFSIVGCAIENLEPNQTDTFLKFYSETSEMESKDLAVLPDGYLILATYSDTTTLLLKTDLKGNRLWAQSFDNFKGSSLTVINDGYILIGDSIDNQNDSTYMQLIKTNEVGENPSFRKSGNGFQRGSAVTSTTNGEVIALGYSTANDSIILMGYNSDLSPAWQSQRNYSSNIPSKSIHESNDGNLNWLGYASSSINFTGVERDSEGVVYDPVLFSGSSYANTDGDFVKTPLGFSVVQTILDINGLHKIALVSSINGSSTGDILNVGDFTTGSYMANSVTNTGTSPGISDGLLIVGTTDDQIDNKDLLLLEVNYDGTLKPDGINQTYGGIGDEIPVRVRRTPDGGYAVLGTSINSKGAHQTFLLKTNNKGALN